MATLAGVYRCLPALLLVVAVAATCTRNSGSKEVKGDTIPVTIGKHTLRVEVAADSLTRERGLMFRKEMPEERGMLFVFPEAQPLSFWMKNTFLPLSIAFLDGDGTILNIEDMAPLDEYTHHRSQGAARYALEVNQGWFDRHGVSAGDHVDFEIPASIEIQ